MHTAHLGLRVEEPPATAANEETQPTMPPAPATPVAPQILPPPSVDPFANLSNEELLALWA